MKPQNLITSALFGVAVLAAPMAYGAPGNGHGCPPGLAKKDNGCLPPGQAKKIYGTGERLDGEYIIIDRPDRFDLDRDGTYYRVGDYVYRVDRETREVLALIGAVSAILN